METVRKAGLPHSCGDPKDFSRIRNTLFFGFGYGRGSLGPKTNILSLKFSKEAYHCFPMYSGTVLKKSFSKVKKKLNLFPRLHLRFFTL
jgi:hypothetical protein